MNRIFLFCILFILTQFYGRVLAGAYDAVPLRGALNDQPHFQTSLGRENHRFAQSKINKYRLYDFYARQARYHLNQEHFLDLLLPYPGLEGGRRGHWGVTNEKLSSAVLERQDEPRYHRLISRGPAGDQYVCITHDDIQSLCLFKGASPTMSRVVLKARLKAPVHAFSYKVDRFGFGMNFKGKDCLRGSGSEWHLPSEKAADVSCDGYHLYQDSVVFRRVVEGVTLLDMPTVDYVEGIPIYTRHFEWTGNVPALQFPLPLATQPLSHQKVTIVKSDDAWQAVVSDGKRSLIHRVRFSEGRSRCSLSVRDGKVWASFPICKKGASIQMSSWILFEGGESESMPKIERVELSSYAKGGPRYFTKEVTSKGVLNADLAASGTAYEIDDIPVPVNNPYGSPMTICGLTFSHDGSAYVCTLVGDVWKVTGLNETLESVRWQRIASGLNSPLGLEFVNGVLHVITQHQILQLYDVNEDGEVDFVKPFLATGFPAGRMHDLQQDSAGNLYSSHVQGIHRITPDGKTITTMSSPSRNPFGLAVRDDGLVLSDSSEGNRGNGTCSIFESEHPENLNTTGKQRRILYLPRGIDHSPGSRLFVNSPKFGPLGQNLLGLSYGAGRIYRILRDPNLGSPQAALQLLPGEFPSGAARLATNPADGQVYVVGMDGWGDFATHEGSFSRVRYTGKKALFPVEWKSYRNGISIKFNQAIDTDSISKSQIFLQQWNYIDSSNTYGSPEYSVRYPSKIGHDRIEVKSIYFSEDRKNMYINAPSLLPAMCTQIYGELKSVSGDKLLLDLYATINQLPKEELEGDQSPSGKKSDLVVPTRTNNGNTYALITEFFDKQSGRDTFKRPVGAVVAYKKNELNYQWIQKNIIGKQGCIACHTTGFKYDFSSHDALMKAIDLKHPEKSHLLGMINAGSMPPFPMPTVAPEMQKALRQWIVMGAPK